MFLTDKLAKKLMDNPDVQRQLVMGLIDNLSQNIESATREVIDAGKDLDVFSSKIDSLLAAVIRSHDLLSGGVVHE